MVYIRRALTATAVAVLALTSAILSNGQQAPSPNGASSPAALTAGMTNAGATGPFLDAAGSGTSVQPQSTPTPMLMFMHGPWMLMAHGLGFLTLQQQTGPRGSDKLYSPNWVMAMAQRDLGRGRLTLTTMFSLEPATITGRFYPELFQTGETAFGRPIVDGQHPHNFFMELAARYDLPLGERGLLTIYAAPMGDPAIGPPAFPHRLSAAQDPLAPLGHHLEDSTHIAADVVTVAAGYGIARWETSAFHGREPDENRWAIQYGSIDSWSMRWTVNPTPNWSAQYSLAHIHSPEALQPNENQLRMTASAIYNRPLRQGNLAMTALWGRTRDLGGRNILNGYLFEANWALLADNHLWTRLENVDKTNELLIGNNPLPAGFVERPLARVQAYSFGYSRDLPGPGWLVPALGAQWTLYHAPASLAPLYGEHPQGVAMFLRLQLGH